MVFGDLHGCCDTVPGSIDDRGGATRIGLADGAHTLTRLGEVDRLSWVACEKRRRSSGFTTVDECAHVEGWRIIPGRTESVDQRSTQVVEIGEVGQHKAAGNRAAVYSAGCADVDGNSFVCTGCSAWVLEGQDEVAGADVGILRPSTCCRDRKGSDSECNSAQAFSDRFHGFWSGFAFLVSMVIPVELRLEPFRESLN